MAALSSGLHDRLGSVRNDISDQMENCVFSGDHLVQRTVIVQKDEKGYGLTVSGHNPVFVQSIKEDGAAARVGVQEGDRIIKVNGTLVTQANHSEVVELIKSGSYVSLTLLGKPYGPNNRLSGGIQSNSLVANHGYGAPNKVSPPFERITGPQPVDAEKQHQLNKEKIHTIKKMLDKEGRYLELRRNSFVEQPDTEDEKRKVLAHGMKFSIPNRLKFEDSFVGFEQFFQL
ncbi:rho guanine nucleotide exchange factor 12-like [Limulus polyphemus]|uniref:Rho guanine nucleotide exchange factor 12-like n=1 Tax=Limulus polyphemus TaxID=6850 RepID=A0ABM1T0J1_LIMPO|nr:rho guanine nucleotide exchange factor 12-like [Limulus polyphemus]